MAKRATGDKRRGENPSEHARAMVGKGASKGVAQWVDHKASQCKLGVCVPEHVPAKKGLQVT